MLASVPGLAKLTRPRLFGAIARARLFDFLDQERERRAICVVGPPGAGKTTLVASYLDSHELPGIWYQVDAGDADLATFFYYLGLAAVGWQGDRLSLPLLTAEYAHDIVGFTRRFFRELFARLPRPATIVLDNYQEVPIDSLFHEIVAAAVDELPASLTLFAISRANPPAHYARLIANQNVALLEWEGLKLTLEETQAIVTARTGAGSTMAERLHERSGGWVAALTLLIERGGDAGERVDGMDRIFDYFAGQIFSRVEPSVQRFLVATALLPRLTPDMAQALTGHADAAEILERLYQRNLFTHRRSSGEPTYQYHALFQAFLLTRGKQLLDDAERRLLAVRAGGLLVSVAMPEEAFALFVQAQAWDAATSVLCGHAQSLLAQGRDQTVRDWASRLPEEQAARPWVRYWIGMAQMLGDQVEARGHVELAWHGFVEAGDIPGQTMAASAMIESYYREWRQFRPLDRWIEVLEDLLARGARPSTTEAQLRVHANLLLAMMYRRPGHPSIGAHARKVFDLLERDAEINERVVIGAFLLSYCAPAAEMTLGARLIELIEPLAAQSRVRPHHRYLWHARRAFFCYFQGDYARGLEQVSAAEAIARAEGFALHLNYMHYRLINLCALDRATAVTELCDAMISVIDTANPQQNWHRWQVQLDEAVVRGDATNADELGDQALAAASLSGLIFLELRTSLAHAWLLALSGRQADLEVVSARVRDTIAGTCFAYFEHDLLMCQAWCLINAGQRQQAQLTLRTVLARAQRAGAVFIERWNARAFRELLAEALEAGIETDYVRRLIRRYAVQPPAREIDAWPWPVRLYTLGRFEVFRDDEAIAFTGKAPRKVLALLKAIVAFGGTHVPQQQILDALWPQDEADLAQKSLGVALARLRKLLGAADAVLLNDQRLSLNPQLCWVDAWAFRRFVTRAEQEYDGLDEDRLIQCAERAVHLYGGVFLPDDLTEPWAVQPRNRLQRRFAHFVEHLAGRLEAAGHWHTALACYDRALEADDLNEAFYRGQMRCYGALRRSADALAVFRRLRQMLSVTLGVKPSAESEALARAISAEDTT